jgi:TetR/AcrR family transcriptional regulator, transcriptional repressor for nem operon
MREIVEKTGLSKGAFYHYFNSKEALFREIAGLFLSMGVIDYSSFSKESLKTFYGQYIEFLDYSLAEMGRMFSDSGSDTLSLNSFLIMFEAAGRFPDFLDRELELHLKDLEAWKSIIATARQNGEVSSGSSDEDIANLFLYCTDGVFIRFMNNDRPSTYKDILQGTYDAIYENIRT